MARMEKQRDKAAKRMERKLNRGNPDADPNAAEPDEFGGIAEGVGLPEGADSADERSPEAAHQSDAAPEPHVASKPEH